AVAGTVARSIELGTGVLQVPLRHPVELAQRVMTTQLFTEGRLVLGVGAGSTEADFAAVDRRFSTRFDELHSSVRIMRRIWRGEIVDGIELPPLPGLHGGPP